MQGPTTLQIVAILIFAVAVFAGILALARRKTESFVPDRTALLAIQNTWRAPAELVSAALPRQVRLSGQSKWLLGFMVLILGGGLFASVAAVRAAFQGAQETERLERDGVEGEAELLRKWMVRGKSTTRYVVYRYEAGGRTYQRRASLPREAFEHIQPGGRVPVRFLPSQPEVSRLPLERPPAPPWTALLVPAVFLVVPWLALRPILIQRRLLQWGQPAAALVARLAPTKGGKTVGYQFTDMSGNTVSGSAIVPALQAPVLRQTVTVVYDPQKPSRNTLYPSSAAEIVPS